MLHVFLLIISLSELTCRQFKKGKKIGLLKTTASFNLVGSTEFTENSESRSMQQSFKKCSVFHIGAWTWVSSHNFEKFWVKFDQIDR